MPRRFRSRLLLLLLLLLLGLLLLTGHPRTSILVSVQNPARQLWTSLWGSAVSDEGCRTPATTTAAGLPDPGERLVAADVYPALDFSLPDNGALGFWDDFLEARYRRTRERWKELPLQVIVVPHSHVDPGWRMTFEDYQGSYVNNILDNLVAFLHKELDFRFIWAEVSFFAEWWKRQNGSTKATLRSILQRGQLEFVTGGWVMADEAATSGYSLIDQLLEGHLWLRHHLGVAPRRGWSVDVFGHSATVPYVLESTGIKEMVIMRTHYAWKKLFARERTFDFRWEQTFGRSEGALCHMAPSDLYSFKFACGPDPEACLQFDFRSVDREYSESTAQEVTDQNVQLKAGLLLSQYGRFASLVPHNVLLVPLGDDFRFNVAVEWGQQLRNYRRLFEYINSRADWYANVRFGTPADYFEEVRRRTGEFRAFEGDFMPYADAYADKRPSYWTGFYSTRPFYKQLSRELEHWLRTAEVLYSLAKTLVPKTAKQLLLKDYSLLTSARQRLALFQHHDAITGTSKQIVMQDYGRKLHAGILDAMTVTSHVSQLLLVEKISESPTWTSQVYAAEYRPAAELPTVKIPLPVPKKGRKIVLFNSLTVVRTEVVCVRVKTPLVKVVGPDGKVVPFQINPVFEDDFAVSSVEFKLLFVAAVDPLSFASYTIVRLPAGERGKFPKTVVSLSLKNEESELDGKLNSAFTFQRPVARGRGGFDFESSEVRALFTEDGSLKEVFLKRLDLTLPLRIGFFTYRPWVYRSGAYLFCPESEHVTPVHNLTRDFSVMSVVRGPLVSEVTVLHHDVLKFSVRLHHAGEAAQGLELEVTHDVGKGMEDAELVMRLASGVDSGDSFFTDSNGFQVLRRRVVRQLPVQANYYPATSHAFLQDRHLRLNLLLPHSHGLTARDGQFEVLLDRKVSHDDGRGVGEGVEDSRRLSSTFWLLTEARGTGVQLSREAFWTSQRLQYPPTVLVSEATRPTKGELSFSDGLWSPDLHLVNLRTLPSEGRFDSPSPESLMVVHRRIDSSCFGDVLPSNDTIQSQLVSSFKLVQVESIARTSLTGSDEDSDNGTLTSPLQAYRVSFSAQDSMFQLPVPQK